MAEAREFGLYNAIGPAKPMTIAQMLYGVKAITTAGAQFTLGAVGVFAHAEHSAVASHDGVAAALWKYGGVSAAQCG